MPLALLNSILKTFSMRKHKRASSFWLLDTRLPFSHIVIRFRYMSFGPLLQYDIKMFLFPGSTAELIVREKRRGMLSYLHN